MDYWQSNETLSVRKDSGKEAVSVNTSVARLPWILRERVREVNCGQIKGSGLLVPAAGIRC